MKKAVEKIENMEKTAQKFLKIGLSLILYILILLALNAARNYGLSGIERVIYAKMISECLRYAAISFVLVVGGGLFADAAIKLDKAKNNG